MATVGNGWVFLKKSNVELSYDTATPLLGICPEERKAGLNQGLAHSCSEQHHSQEPEDGRNTPSVHQQTNG